MLAGGKLTGSWSVLSPTDPRAGKLSTQWDAVYGQGYYVSTILGSQDVVQATATGDKGTVLQVEFHREQLGVPEDNHFGVAVDSKGNIYKAVL